MTTIPPPPGLRFAWNRRRFLGALGGSLAVASFSGCPFGAKENPAGSAKPFLGHAIKVFVLADPPLAEKLKPIVEGWSQGTGATVQVEAIEAGAWDTLQGESIVVFSAEQLPELARQGKLAPFRSSFLDDSDAQWHDVFPLLQTGLCHFGDQTLASPLSHPTTLLYYRADWFKARTWTAPRSWGEYQAILDALSDPTLVAEFGVDADFFAPAIEPLAPGFAFETFLRRASGYVWSPGSYSTLLDVETLEPRLQEPGFVRALQELCLAQGGYQQSLESDAEAARTRFWKGETAMTMLSPRLGSAIEIESSPAVAFATLPGASETWNAVKKAWEELPEGEFANAHPLSAHSTLLGLGAGEHNGDAAERLMVALLTGDNAKTLASGGTYAGPVRQSQGESPSLWCEERLSAEGAKGAFDAVRKTLTQGKAWYPLPIPGAKEYATALDGEVRRAVAGEKTVKEALSDAATAWREITSRLGQERQRAALRGYWGLA